MADYTLAAKITGDSSSFERAFGGALEKAKALSDQVKTAGQKVSDLGQKTAITGAAITAGITTPFVGAIKMTADFDSAMRKAGAIAGASATELDLMTKAALDLGASTSLSSSEVAIAMTDMAAKGFDANQVIAAMPGVIAAAEASGEDLALTANTVASALNGFQLKAEDSGNVADILAMAANKTAAGVSDMSYAFKYAAAPAASLGISIEELSAATGIMVNAGLDGSQAGTSLRMSLIRLAKPTEESSKTMEKLGFDVLDAKGNFKPLNEIIGELTKSMDGMTEAQKLANLATIFGTEAATGMLILMNEGQDGIKGLTTELENSSGASAEAAAQMKAGIGGALENLSGAVESATISVMSQLTPLISDIARWTTEIVEKFNSLDDGTKKMIAMAVGILAASGPVLTILGLLIMGLGGLISAVGFLISPIGLVITAILALAGVFGYFMATNESFRNSIFSTFQSVVSFIQTSVGQIKTLLESMYDVVFGSMSVKDNADLLASIGFDPEIASRLMSITSKIGGIITSFWDIWFGSMSVKDNVDFMQLLGISESTATNVGNIASTIQNVVTGAIDIIKSTLSSVPGVFSSVMGTLGGIIGSLGTIFSSVWQVIQTFFTSLIGGFQSAGGLGSGFGIQILSLFLGLNPIVKLAISLFQNFGPEIAGAFQQIVAMVLPVVATLGTALGQLASAVIPLIMQAISTLIPVIIQMGMTLMTIISAVLPILIGLFNQLFPIIMQVVMIVIDLVAQFMPLVAVIISSLLPVIQNLILAFMNIVQAVAPAFIAIIQLIIGVIQALLPIIMSIITVVVHVFAGIVSTISPIVAFIAAIISAIMAVISPIIVFVAGVITSIVAVIRPIIVTVTGIFNTIFSVVSGVWRNIMTFIGSAINKISSIINGVSSTVSSVFSSVFSTISRIMDKVSSKVSGVFSAIQSAWGGLTAFVSGVFSGISGSIQTLVSQVKGFINGVIGGINAAVSLINKIPGVSISKIPMLARGTDDWQGGFALMNEGGRGELVNLPNGSQVIPHDVSMRYAREAGRNTSDQSGGRYQPAGNDMSRVEAWLEKIANSNQVVVLDSGALVGGTYNEYDRVGGTKTVLTERWEY